MIAELENHGSLFLFRPMDMEAEEWCDDNISDDRTAFGHSIVIEPRYVNGVIDGFKSSGGVITTGGYS